MNTPTTNIDWALHVCRNPHGHSDESVRGARLLLADTVERLQADLTSQLAAKESEGHIYLTQSERAAYQHERNKEVRAAMDAVVAKESAEQEPVARVNAEGFIVEIGDVALANGTKLYTSSPTTSAAVAAFRRKAAEVCRESSVGYSRTNHDGRSPVASYKADACDEMAEEIAALPANDSALREICVAVAKQANYCSGRSQQELEAIVNEVLGK